VEAGLSVSGPRAVATVDAALGAAAEILDRVDTAVLRSRRREELLAEDAVLAAEEATYERLRDDVERSARNAAQLEGRLRRMLDATGMPLPERDPALAVAENVPVLWSMKNGRRTVTRGGGLALPLDGVGTRYFRQRS